MKSNTLTPTQMRELASYGLDTSDASLYINDVTADGIDNGQLLVNLYPNDGSRQHEIEHSHVIFIYSITDALRKIPNTNVQVTNCDGFHTVNIYGEKIYENNKAIEDIDNIISIAQEAISFCDYSKPWELASMNEIVECLYRIKNNIVAFPNTQKEYKVELISEAIYVSKDVYHNFDNLTIKHFIENTIKLLQELRHSYENIIFSYKSTEYNEVLFECMKYLLSNGKKLKRLR